MDSQAPPDVPGTRSILPNDRTTASSWTSVPKVEESSPSVEKPPLPRIVYTPSAASGAIIPLSRVEQSCCESTIDIAFAFQEIADPDRLQESLSQALDLLPSCAGRYVQREVMPEGLPEGETRICILCNNAGMAFGVRSCIGATPPFLGPLPESFFDRAIGTLPDAKGALGGPLLRINCLSFDDGQLLAVSFSQGLTDIGGMGVLLRVWAQFYRGEEVMRPPTEDRLDLEASLVRSRPRLETGYALLHHPHDAKPALRPCQPVVACFTLVGKDLDAVMSKTSQTCRQKRLIYDSESFDACEVAYGLVAEAFAAGVPASLWVDYRAAFGVTEHFGIASGLVDLQLPKDAASASATTRKQPVHAQTRDFWAWKAAQQTRASASKLVLSSWLSSLEPLDSLAFAEGSGPQGVALSGSFWQELAGRGAASRTVVLPCQGGVQVQAMLPQKVAERLSCEGRELVTWIPK